MDSTQFYTFQDALARRIISTSPAADEDDSALNEFASYLAQEAFSTLPLSFQASSFEDPAYISPDIPNIDAIDGETLPLDSIPPTFVDSLISYGYVCDTDAAQSFLRAVIRDYLVDATAPPPKWKSTRTEECEICERTVPLTYHHLIPRSVHTKVLKKGWHAKEMLNSVAWLCRPCHSAVHHVASNEDLAKSFYTVELLLEREDLTRWRAYASKQRWGVRRG